MFNFRLYLNQCNSEEKMDMESWAEADQDIRGS